MIKLFAVFLSIYILSQALTPCMDNDISSSCVRKLVVNAMDSPNDKDHHDCCSPFCTCSCCSLPFEGAGTFVMVRDFSLSQTLSFCLTDKFESQYTFSIWEPPKS